MQSDMYLFNHWGDCLLIVMVPRPGFPDEVNEQAPQHQINDNEGYGEPQGHIVEVIEEIHLAQNLHFFSNDIALTQIAFLMRIFSSAKPISLIYRTFSCRSQFHEDYNTSRNIILDKLAMPS